MVQLKSHGGSIVFLHTITPDTSYESFLAAQVIHRAAEEIHCWFNALARVPGQAFKVTAETCSRIRSKCRYSTKRALSIPQTEMQSRQGL